MRSSLIQSLSPRELDEYKIIRQVILDKGTFLGDIAVVADDPYLAALIIAVVSGIYDSRIHILNKLEGIDEVQRLIYYCKPDTIICTDENYYLSLKGIGKILITDDVISNTRINPDLKYDEYNNYRIITYSPTPVRVKSISCEMIDTMIDSLVSDFNINGIKRNVEKGIIPIFTDNIDYLLYFIALKILYSEQTLPYQKEISAIMNGSKDYKKHNNCETLFIPQKEFVELWDDKITPLFETKFVFKMYLRFAWIVNLCIGYKLKKIFKGFNNIVIIGRLESLYMVNIIKSLSGIKVFNINSIEPSMQFGLISPIGKLKVKDTSQRQIIHFKPKNLSMLDGDRIKMVSYKISPKNKPMTVYPVTDIQSLYLAANISNKDGTNSQEFQYIGNVNNILSFKGHTIFPERLEKTINSYPFVKYCALLQYKNRLVLVVVPHSNISDANRINYGMFKRILKRNLNELSKMLPAETEVGSVVISNSVVEKDRNGNIMRYLLHTKNN